MKASLHHLSCIPVCLLLQACTTPPAAPGLYDLGSAPQSASLPAGCSLPAIAVPELTTIPALDSNQMLYRLQYVNDQQAQAYASHRWTMTPAQLMTARLRSNLVAASVRIVDSGVQNPDGWQLRAELTDFGQYFSDAQHSVAHVQLRATLLRGNRMVAQSAFAGAADADAPDAPAGARAMRQASDALLGDLNAWLCKQPR